MTTTPHQHTDRRSSTTPLPPFRTPVRGHAFAPRPPDVPAPLPGEAAELVPEPGNPADPHAVAVWLGSDGRRWRIGYLDRGVAARVAPRLREGLPLRVRMEGWTREPEGRWQRPLVLLEDARIASDPRAQGQQPGRGARVGGSDGAGEEEPGRAAPTDGSAGAGGERAVGRVAPPAGGGVWGRPPGVSRRTLPPARRRG